jgi:hypothetical protein
MILRVESAVSKAEKKVKYNYSTYTSIIHIYTHTFTHTHTCMYMYMYMYMYMCTHIHTHTHTHSMIYSHSETHPGTCTQALLGPKAWLGHLSQFIFGIKLSIPSIVDSQHQFSQTVITTSRSTGQELSCHHLALYWAGAIMSPPALYWAGAIMSLADRGNGMNTMD